MRKAKLIVVLLMLQMTAFAQGNPGLPDGDPDVPIDGGMVALLVAGAAYGVKKIRDMKDS